MKINIINKLPFIVVAGLNFSAMLLTLITCTLRKYYEALNLSSTYKCNFLGADNKQ